MKFLIDECTGPAVAKWLMKKGYNVFSVFEETPGISDDAVLDRAREENRILITNDKDFGEKIYRQQKSHQGVILLRLKNERSKNKIKVLKEFGKE